MKGSVTPVLTDPIIGSELIFAVKGKTNYMIPIDELVAAASFTPGVEPEFLSWDKTWRQVDYSMLSGTPALVEDFGDLGDVPDYTSDDALKFIRVNSSYSGLEYATVNIDLSNYVTIDSDQTITGSKTFQNSAGIKISKGAGLSSFWIYPNTTGSATGYITTAGAITSNQAWYFPHDKTGTLALMSDLPFYDWSVTYSGNTTDYKRIDNKIAISTSNTAAFPNNGKVSLLNILEDELNYSILVQDRFGRHIFSTSTNVNVNGVTYLIGVVQVGSILDIRGTSIGVPSGLRINNSYHSILFKAITKGSHLETTYEFPSDGTTGQVLTTNGAGILSWTTVSGGGTIDVFTNIANGLVPAPDRTWTSGTRFLADDATWKEVATGGITTSIEVSGGTARTGVIVLAPGSGIAIAESPDKTFTFYHADTSSVASTSTTDFNIISSLTFDTFGHVTAISTRSLLPVTSNGYFLRDDGVWVSVTGGGGGTVTSVAAGNGMNFTTFTTSGSVTLGTPSSITSTSTNSVGAGTHTHAISGFDNYQNWGLADNGTAAVNIGSGAVVRFYGAGGTVVTRESNNIIITSSTTGTPTFLALSDTPSSYSGQGLKAVRVNSEENALEFYTVGSGGTVTSVGMTVPTGFTRTPSTITTSGTFTVGYDTGYSLPLTADTAKGVTAYSWGNHALAGYITGEIDPTGVSNVSVTGTTTKTIRITLNNTTYKEASWTDLVGEPGSGATQLDELNDVVLTSRTLGDLLRYNGTDWVNWAPNFLTEETLFNAWIAETVAANKYYGTNSSGTKGYHTLPTQSYYWDLQVENNTTASIVEGNKVLFEVGTGLLLLYNNNGIGTYTVTYELNASLNNLNNVVITTPDTNQILRYNGSTWVNSVDTALSWGDHSTFGYLARLQVNGGITLEGTTINPILKIVSANQANTGQVSIIGDTLGVVLGTDEYSAAAGNHTHTELHSKRHPITSSSDHTASANKVFYSNNSSIITELSLGASNTILTSNGATSAPTFTSFYDFDGYNGTKKALVPLATPLLIGGATETRYLRADGQWSIPVSTGTSMSNPMTTAMDIIIGGTGGIPTRFGKGSANQVLGINSTNDAFEWKTLSSTFTLALTRDVIAGSNQITYLQPAAINNKSGVGTLLDAHEFLVNVINTGLRKATALEIKTYLDPFNAQGQLLVGDVSGNSSVIAPNTSSTVTVLSQASSITSWKIFNFSSLNDVPVAYNSSNSLNIIKVNGGGTGLGYMKVIITDGTNSSGLSLNGTGTELISKLEYESTPKLSVSLNANSKSILDSGTITPGNVNVSTGISPYTLGTYAKKWNYAYLGELISNIVTTTTLQIGSWKFQTSGTSLVFKYGNTTKAELMQDGNMKFFM